MTEQKTNKQTKEQKKMFAPHPPANDQATYKTPLAGLAFTNQVSFPRLLEIGTHCRFFYAGECVEDSVTKLTSLVGQGQASINTGSDE